MTRERCFDGALRIGLVLGAGGLVGLAHHAGSLAALELNLGWDPRSADVIVGSSAGSIVATLLRAGISAQELAARYEGESGMPLLMDMEQIERQLPPLRVSGLFHRWSAPSRNYWRNALRSPRTLRIPPVSALLPRNGHPGIDCQPHIQQIFGESWPEGLWLCATKKDSGKRAVFGEPSAPHVGLSDAIAASCAVPTYFEPVVIRDTEYIDGGLRSSTNADVLSGCGLDVVVVVAPMSTADPKSREWTAPMRWWAHRHAKREVAKLREAGADVLLIEPGTSVRHEMGLDPMGQGRGDRVMRSSFFEGGQIVSRKGAQRAVAALSANASL